MASHSMKHRACLRTNSQELSTIPFIIISQPNNWARRVTESARRSSELSELQLTQFEYWSSFASYLEDSKSKLRVRKPRPQYWMDFSIGRAGVHLTAQMSTWNSESQSYDEGEIRAGLYIGANNSKEIFKKLSDQKDQIEHAFGEKLEWYNDTDKKSAQIRVKTNANVLSQNDWTSQHQWLKVKLERLQSVFGSMIKDLP